MIKCLLCENKSDIFLLVGYPILFEHAHVIQAVGDFFLVMRIHCGHGCQEDSIDPKNFSPYIENRFSFSVVEEVLKERGFTQEESINGEYTYSDSRSSHYL